VLQHDAALGHRERRDRSLRPRVRSFRRRRHGCACGLGWAGLVRVRGGDGDDDELMTSLSARERTVVKWGG
jgi:hypothetical protein